MFSVQKILRRGRSSPMFGRQASPINSWSSSRQAKSCTISCNISHQKAVNPCSDSPLVSGKHSYPWESQGASRLSRADEAQRNRTPNTTGRAPSSPVFLFLQNPHHTIIRIHLYQITVLQNLRRNLRPDDAGLFQLTCDNSGMTSNAALVGNKCRCLFHGR